MICKYILYVWCALFSTNIFLLNNAQAQGIGRLYAKVVHSGNSSSSLNGRASRKFILRVRELNKMTGNHDGRIITLRGEFEIDSSVDRALLRIKNTTKYGVFDIYKKGYGWNILNAYPLDVRIRSNHSPKNNMGSLNAGSDEVNNIILIIDEDNFNIFENNDTKVRSFNSGNTGISVGN